jgi:putative flippase GtrA
MRRAIAKVVLVSDDLVRFLFAGGINTGLTTLVYLFLASVLSPTVAYAIAWTIGLAFVGVVYPDRVFPGGRNAFVDRVAIVGSAISVFLVGAFLLRGLIPVFGGHIIPFLLTMITTTVLNFTISRSVIRRSGT